MKCLWVQGRRSGKAEVPPSQQMCYFVTRPQRDLLPASLEKEMATHSSVLAWGIPRMGEPGGLPSMGSHRVGHD